MRWWHADPHGGSLQKWDEGHAMAEQEESDPTGVNVGASNPFENTGGDPDPLNVGVNLVPNDPSGKCRVNGQPIYCAQSGRLARMDSLLFVPVESFRALRFRNVLDPKDVRTVLGQYNPVAGGYVPVGVSYIRGGSGGEYVFQFGDGSIGSGAPVGYGQQAGGAGLSQIAPNHTALTKEETNILRSDIKDLIGDKKCGDLIRTILQKLGGSRFNTENILDIFEAAVAVGMNWRSMANAGETGKDGSSKGVFHIDINPTYSVFKNLGARTHASVAMRAEIVIHELLHFAGPIPGPGESGFNDGALANAVTAAATTLGYKNIIPVPNRVDYPFTTAIRA